MDNTPSKNPKPSAPAAGPRDNLASTTPETTSGGGPESLEGTQLFNDTVPTTQDQQKTTPPGTRPSQMKTVAAGLGATEMFSEKPAAPAKPKAAATAPAASRPAAKSQPAHSLGSTEAFVEGGPAATKPAAPRPQATRPMDATGEFTDSPEAAADQTQPIQDRPAPSKPAAKAPIKPPSESGVPAEGETFGDYRLDKKLGEGGMGAVYKAHQISMDRTVALKMLAKNLGGNQGFVERFYREARSMVKVDHPNIVRGYAVGEADGQHFMAMEFVDGASMQKWMDKHKKLPVADAVHVVLCTAHALHHAHEQTMVHRDIKPDNILMTSKGVVKLADLGLAKRTDDDMSLTQSGTGFGTPYYMPLEQYRDAKRVDARADIYALGVTLYYFLTGKLPFFGETHFDVIKLKEAAKFTPARKHNPEIPERLDLMIDKMIQKDPKHRYQSCAEVIEALESLGLASEFPSFIGAPPPAAKSGPATARPSTLPPKSKSKTDPPPVADEAAREMWVLRYKDETGKTAKRQVSTGRLKQLIERGEIDPSKATVHRINEQNQRPISSYTEFASLVQSKVVEARADKRSQKLENAYDRLERDAKRQKLVRTIKSVGVKLVILAVVVGALAFGAKWFFANKDSVMKKVQDATKAAQEPAGASGSSEQPKQ
jgi:serine/threonine-protein kinase